jgi:hypothetical protein
MEAGLEQKPGIESKRYLKAISCFSGETLIASSLALIHILQTASKTGSILSGRCALTSAFTDNQQLPFLDHRNWKSSCSSQCSRERSQGTEPSSSCFKRYLIFSTFQFEELLKKADDSGHQQAKAQATVVYFSSRMEAVCCRQ